MSGFGRRCAFAHERHSPGGISMLNGGAGEIHPTHKRVRLRLEWYKLLQTWQLDTTVVTNRQYHTQSTTAIPKVDIVNKKRAPKKGLLVFAAES
jgi:hypothetical protein